ncbi:hypothetical protein [Hymenobacter norwichensis]|uniref:hypothetical protein n=1 Tax=Hymenobacter norwichensis TaxID=223903 RepID=UPI0003B516C9|nr:hypothetical protein [Hymenobacter norwichensis]
MPDLSSSNSLTNKTDAQLLFLAQNPSLYHPDLIVAALQELRRRGISPEPATPVPRPHHPRTDEDVAEPAFWQRPAPWVGLLVVLLMGSILYWNNMQSKAAQTVAVRPVEEKPIVLETVETHLIPTFDSLTRTQIAQEMRQLTVAERTADTASTRRYRILATRYWDAENQSGYLFGKLNGKATDAVLANQAPVVIETWRRLTKALVYDHSLTPVLAERINLMRRAAYLRIQALQEVARHAQNDQPILDPSILNLRDSATHMRESLLSREEQRRQMQQMRF